MTMTPAPAGSAAGSVTGLPELRPVHLANGLTTTVLESGRKRAGQPSLLLLHGWMATASLNWYRVVQDLAPSYHVVAPNLRGHGRDGARAGRFTTSGVAQDQALLVEQLGLGPVAVVGYSMGGALAQVLARQHPGLVAGLVLCATAATFPELTWTRPIVKVVGRAGGALTRSMPRLSQTAMAHYLRRRDAAGEAAGHAHARWAQEERASSSLACFIESGAALNAFQSGPWLHELSVPTAVIITTEDHRVPPWRQDSLAALIPGSRRLTLAGGHDAVVARPDEFVAVLRVALASVGAPAP